MITDVAQAEAPSTSLSNLHGHITPTSCGTAEINRRHCIYRTGTDGCLDCCSLCCPHSEIGGEESMAGLAPVTEKDLHFNTRRLHRRYLLVALCLTCRVVVCRLQASRQTPVHPTASAVQYNRHEGKSVSAKLCWMYACVKGLCQ